MPAEIHAFIDHLNQSWRQGDFDAVATCYHERAVLLPPDQGAPITGRDAITAVYQEFGQLAQLDRFEVTEMEVFEFPPSAVCHMHFELDYHLDSEPRAATGLEIYLVQHTNGQLKICWRQQLMFEDSVMDP